MDFPGTIAVEGEPSSTTSRDIGKSLAHHGFRKILLVNGHGSNVPFLDMAARNITNRSRSDLRHGVMVEPDPEASFRRTARVGIPRRNGAWLRTRDVGVPLPARRPGADGKSRRISTFQRTEYFYWDLQAPSPVFFQEWFSRYSKTGTVGDPTKARAKGRTVRQRRGGPNGGS